MQIMTKRTKIILLILVAITAIATVFAALYKPTRTNTIARPIIKIGFYLPLSGSEAHIGLAARQAVNLALQNQGPSSKYRYDVIFEDSAANPAVLEDTKTDITFSLSPEPRLTLASGPDKADSFILHTPYQEAAKLLAQDIKNRGIRNVGFITEAVGDYRPLAKALNDSLSGTAAFSGAVFKKGQTDFTAIINKLRNNDSEIFVIAASPESLDNLVQELNLSGISNYQISSLYSVDLSSRPELYEHIRYSGSQGGLYDSDLAVEAVKTIINAYENNYKKDLVPGPAVISSYLAENRAQNGIISIPAELKKVEDGKIITIKE